MTAVLVLSQDDVVELLDMEGCIAAMDEAFRSLARREVFLPLRPVVRPPGEPTFLGLMPVFRGGERPVYALKTVAVAPENAARGLDPHQGTVTLFDGDHRPDASALMNASAVTSIRTAACSAVATRALAREDATELAVVGAGHQAHAHVRAMLAVRDFERVRIASRNRDHAAGSGGRVPERRGLRHRRGGRARRGRRRAPRRARASRSSPRVAEARRARERRRRVLPARRASWTPRPSPTRSSSSTAASRPRTRPATS